MVPGISISSTDAVAGSYSDPAKPASFSLPATLAVIGAGWLALWLAGLPFPNGDDPFFAGAAIQLANTGQLANPWIVNWMQHIPDVHSTRFYVHPPFGSYLLAAWLKLFGVSAASTSAYACFVGACSAAAAALLLRQYRAGPAAAALGALLVTAYSLHRGLRPEIPGIAFLLFGQILLSRGGRKSFFAGAALTFASTFCHAFMVTLAGPALLFHLWSARPPSGQRGLLRERLRLIGGAGLTVLLLFLATIRGELGAFLNDFLGHAQLVTPSATKLALFVGQLLLGWTLLPNLLALGSAALLVFGRLLAAPNERPTIVVGVLVFIAMVASGMFLYAPFAAIYAVMTACFLVLIWSARLPRLWRTAALAPALAFVAWGSLEHGLEYTINHRTAPTDVVAIRRYVEQVNPSVLLFDASSLRYVFDFRPPPNSYDIAWSWSPGMSARWWSPDALEGRDLWVIQPTPELDGIAAKLRPQPPMLLGRAFASIQPADELIVLAGSASPKPPAGFPFLAVRNHTPDQPVRR